MPGVSPMAAYRHFADLDGFLAAVAAASFEKLIAHLRAAEAKLPPGDGPSTTICERIVMQVSRLID